MTKNTVGAKYLICLFLGQGAVCTGVIVQTFQSNLLTPLKSLLIEAAGRSETSVKLYQTVGRHIQNGSNIYSYRPIIQMSLNTKCLLYIIRFHEWLSEDWSHTVLSWLPVTSVAMVTTEVERERERERERPSSLWGMWRGRERFVCNSECCLRVAQVEAEETVVCNWECYLCCLCRTSWGWRNSCF